MVRGVMIVAVIVLLLALAPGAAAQEGTGAPPSSDPAGWSALVLPQTEDIHALATGVAVGPEAIVAVGQRACHWRNRKTGDIGRCWGQPWISTDGITWEAVPARISGLDLGRFTMATSGPEVGVEGVAYGPGGYVAYGWAGAASDQEDADVTGPGPALWRSADGRSWERVPTPESFVGDYLMLEGPWLRSIAGSEVGYLLGGTIYGTPAPRAAIWSSPDGLAWTLAAGDDVFDVGAYIDTMEVPVAGGVAAIAVPPGSTSFAGAVAAGSACPVAEKGAGPTGGDWRKTYEWTTGNCWAQTWQTDDGLTWETRAIEVADAQGAQVDIYGARALAASSDASVVGAYPELVLYSEDGSDWAVAGGGRLGRQAALTADEVGFHALVPKCDSGKCRRQTLESWASPDGAAWGVDASQPSMPSGVEDFIDVDVAPFGDRIIVTAGYWTAPRSDLASMALLSPPLEPLPEITPEADVAPAAPTNVTVREFDPRPGEECDPGPCGPIGVRLRWTDAPPVDDQAGFRVYLVRHWGRWQGNPYEWIGTCDGAELLAHGESEPELIARLGPGRTRYDYVNDSWQDLEGRPATDDATSWRSTKYDYGWQLLVSAVGQDGVESERVPSPAAEYLFCGLEDPTPR